MEKRFCFFFVLCLFSLVLFAQDGEKTIIDELNSPKWGQGKVRVMQDEAIDGLIAVRHETDSTKKLGVIDPNAAFVKVKGYKIQVYSGNNQQYSKREAEGRKTQIHQLYPEYEAIVNFQSPFWRVRVGNFLKREDAETVLKELKKAFPVMGREMTVVADTVKKPVE